MKLLNNAPCMTCLNELDLLLDEFDCYCPIPKLISEDVDFKLREDLLREMNHGR